MYFKKFEIYYTIWFHIILLLLKVVGYEYVNFQKMTKMHKDYAYQFFDFIFLKKLQQRTKNLKTQTKTYGGIEPQFYDELYPIAQPHPTQTHPNPQC